MSTPWIETEIRDLAPLGAEEVSLLEMHSVLNTISLLVGELNLIGLALEKDLEWMKEGLSACRKIVASLRNREQAIQFTSNLAGYKQAIDRDIERALTLHPERRTDPYILESVSNIESVFSILVLRTREILARAQSPEHWAKLDIFDLQKDFIRLFEAVEKNSKGRYRIVFNQPRRNPSDYWVHFDITSYLGDEVLLPPALVDVMRDLMANARKYSLPGATISAELNQTAEGVRFVVQDSGRGIPKAEIQTVVTFGMRGSNVSDVRTMGGGFGLTKALFVTKQFKGRMWIASRIGVGTRIRIEIPTREEQLSAAVESIAELRQTPGGRADHS